MILVLAFLMTFSFLVIGYVSWLRYKHKQTNKILDAMTPNDLQPNYQSVDDLIQFRKDTKYAGQYSRLP